MSSKCHARRAGRLPSAEPQRLRANAVAPARCAPSTVTSLTRWSLQFRPHAQARPCPAPAPTPTDSQHWRPMREQQFVATDPQQAIAGVRAALPAPPTAARSPRSIHADTPTRSARAVDPDRAHPCAACACPPSAWARGSPVAPSRSATRRSPPADRADRRLVLARAGPPPSSDRPRPAPGSGPGRGSSVRSADGPGSRPEYIATCNWARPMSSSVAPLPTCRPSRMKRGPRRVHSARALRKTHRLADAVAQPGRDPCQDGVPPSAATGWRRPPATPPRSARTSSAVADPATRVADPSAQGVVIAPRAAPRRTVPAHIAHRPGSGCSCRGIPPARRPTPDSSSVISSTTFGEAITSSCAASNWRTARVISRKIS